MKAGIAIKRNSHPLSSSITHAQINLHIYIQNLILTLADM